MGSSYSVLGSVVTAGTVLGGVLASSLSVFGAFLGRLLGVLEPSWSVLKASRVVLRWGVKAYLGGVYVTSLSV